VGLRQLAEWILEAGGPVLRYRVAREILNVPASESELLAAAPVRAALARVRAPAAGKTLHGSRADHFENAIGKLADLGCRAGMAPLDRRTRAHLHWLETEDDPDWYARFQRQLVANGLALAGYDAEPAVRESLEARLELLASFARRKRYDIYVDPVDYPGYPRQFRGRPLVDPALCPDGRLPLPSIWDLYGLARLRANSSEAPLRRKTDAVARYILNDAYQALAPGYGTLRTGRYRYWAIGWDVKLPGFRSGRTDPSQGALALQRLELMAVFPSARRTPWFRSWLAHLEEYRTDRGSWAFPRAYLPEKPSGYWVLASQRGLEQARRRRLALELESTFRMLSIKQLSTC
jgi:hypothetical protein